MERPQHTQLISQQCATWYALRGDVQHEE
eukprot:SAG31_NODE_33191_length_346_cov_8.631579_1_plen_28_part_01